MSTRALPPAREREHRLAAPAHAARERRQQARAVRHSGSPPRRRCHAAGVSSPHPTATAANSRRVEPLHTQLHPNRRVPYTMPPSPHDPRCNVAIAVRRVNRGRRRRSPTVAVSVARRAGSRRRARRPPGRRSGARDRRRTIRRCGGSPPRTESGALQPGTKLLIFALSNSAFQLLSPIRPGARVGIELADERARDVDDLRIADAGGAADQPQDLVPGQPFVGGDVERVADRRAGCRAGR